MSVLDRGFNRVSLHYTVTPTPGDPGEAVLEAWWPETMCSPLPCKTLVSQWSDGGWRVATQRDPHETADEAARVFLLEHTAVS